MKTIAEILETCQKGDKLTNNFFEWTVTERYREEGELVIIAQPHIDNTDSFELWSCGTEKYSIMPNLKKIEI